MYFAMNRFRINIGIEEQFETVWRERESYLTEVPGCMHFALLRESKNYRYTLYASHSVWESKSDFEAWTRSEAFRKAHGQRSAPKGTYVGHPQVETFQQVL